MTEEKRKLCYEFFYLVKGHLKYFCDEDLELIYKEYFKRLWYNTEINLYYDGFEEEYNKFLKGSKGYGHRRY